MHIKTVQNGFFLLLVTLVTVAFLVLLQDFLQPLFWAAVLAVIFYPLYLRFQQSLRSRSSLSAVLTIFVILAVVILPLFLIGMAVTQEATDFYERIAAGEIDLQQPIQTIEQVLPAVRDFMDRFNIDTERIRQGLSGTAVTISTFLASEAINIGQNALRFTVFFFLMLYLLFFFLRDGRRILDSIVMALPLGDAREQQLFDRFAEVSRATIKGTIVVGIIQGTLGGFLFWLLGIQAAVFWGVVMTILSLLPAVGAALVWVPAAIVLLATGEIVKGVILIAAGTLIIGLVDNVLRPILVGRDTRMPDYLILLSTLGGLTLFGVSGFIIGPVIAALFLSVWEMFEKEYGSLDDPTRPSDATVAAPPVDDVPSEA